jgi:uncharacterized protein (TIGR00369 family)
MNTNSEMEAFHHKHDHQPLASGNGHDFVERIRGNQFEMSGMDYLVAMIRGELPMPPFMTTLGLDQIAPQVEPGKIVFFLEARKAHYNGIGTVHGGVISTLLDSAMACTVQSMLPAGVGFTTLELKVSFLRSLTKNTGACAPRDGIVVDHITPQVEPGKIVFSSKPESHITTE